MSIFGIGSKEQEMKKQLEEKTESIKKDLETVYKNKETQLLKEVFEIEKNYTQLKSELSGEYLERYTIAKSLGLEFQAEVAKIEGLTNTTLMDIDFEINVIFNETKKQNPHFHSHQVRCVPFTEYKGKITLGVLVRYQELKNSFDQIEVMYPEQAPDPILYGVKHLFGENHYFKIMKWI